MEILIDSGEALRHGNGAIDVSAQWTTAIEAEHFELWRIELEPERQRHFDVESLYVGSQVVAFERAGATLRLEANERGWRPVCGAGRSITMRVRPQRPESFGEAHRFRARIIGCRCRTVVVTLQQRLEAVPLEP